MKELGISGNIFTPCPYHSYEHKLLNMRENHIFDQMIRLSHIQKIAFATIFLMAVQVAFASISFTGITDERNKNMKYSLKNLSLYSHKSISISGLKSELEFKGSSTVSQRNNASGIEINSTMQYDKGNTTFVFPYKVKIKIYRDKIRIPLH